MSRGMIFRRIYKTALLIAMALCIASPAFSKPYSMDEYLELVTKYN